MQNANNTTIIILLIGICHVLYHRPVGFNYKFHSESKYHSLLFVLSVRNIDFSCSITMFTRYWFFSLTIALGAPFFIVNFFVALAIRASFFIAITISNITSTTTCWTINNIHNCPVSTASRTCLCQPISFTIASLACIITCKSS